MKLLLTAFLSLCGLYATCQTITKYYDNIWNEVPAERAVYYATFVKHGSEYETTSYWKDNNAVRGKSTYLDTTFSSPDGLQLMYDKKGRLEDSIYYTNGKPQFLYHYYSNGQLAVHYHLPDGKKEGITEGWDESGKKIKNFITMKEAEFKGGEDAWGAYLRKNTSKDLSVTDNKNGVSLNVEVEFVVDEDGSVVKQKIRKSSGYKNVDNDALRVISESPKWSPAILYNKPVRAYRVQPITYDIPAPQ